MAADTATGNPSNTIQSCPVTEGAGLMNIPCRVVESSSGPGPGGRMGIIGTMTRFTTHATGTVNTYIELWIASRTAGWIVRVTGLAHCQVCLGHWAMVVRFAKGAVEWMRNPGSISTQYDRKA